MEIDDTIIDKLEVLAKLKLNEDERKVLKNEISQMVEMFDKISEIDTTHVVPLRHMTDNYNIMRADEPINRLTHEEGLKNAPKPIGRHFSVPKVIE